MNTLTVEDALNELHSLDPKAYWRIIDTAFGTFQGYAPDLKFIPHHETEIVFTPWACGQNDQRIFRAASLDLAMASVRKWKESQRS